MDRCDVVVSGFRLNATEQPTKVLQRLLGLDEMQARALSKRFPSVVRTDQAWADAERLMLALRDAGAYVHLREPGARSEPPAAGTAPNTVPPINLLTQPTPARRPVPEPTSPAAPSAATVPAPIPLPVAPSAQPFAAAPGSFRSAGEEAARVSLYELGELEIGPSKSRPAPAMPAQRMRSEPAPSPRIPAEPQPPASTAKSQPAPPPSKGQPAAPMDVGLANGGLAVFGDSFGDSFGDETDHGGSLELDERALGPQTNRIEVQPWRQNQPNEARKRRGFFATLFLPLVLVQAAIPNALALTGVAAASGAAVYMVRRADPPENDKQLDQRDEPGTAQSSAAATHPLVRLAPAAMEGSVASILRTRFRGLHKVRVKWDEATKPTGHVECLLLDQAEAGHLKELASTGKVVPIPPEVREQLEEHILSLRTADANPSAVYLPICLAN